MSAMDVGKLLATNSHLFSTSEFTLEKGLMSAVYVGNSLLKTPALLCTKEFTLPHSLINAVYVENSLPPTTTLLHTSEFTGAQGLMSAVNVGNLLINEKASSSRGMHKNWPFSDPSTLDHRREKLRHVKRAEMTLG